MRFLLKPVETAVDFRTDMLCYRQMEGLILQEVAVIRMFSLADGSPGVRLETEPDFMKMEPIDRATLLNAALHLCVTAINAIADDHPDDADDIMERLAVMSIAPNDKSMAN